MKFVIATIMILIGAASYAHEMVPTYPSLEPSYMDGLYKTTLTVFNKRKEVQYYEIGVFTSEWDPIPFVSKYKIYKIPYLSTVSFEIFIRKTDSDRAVYICSKSKLRKEDVALTGISSKICSKIKR